ncbi:MAG: 4Fe-4S cluster-binding domain-containing protein [Bacteroidota bacterium]|nr:4Fe-4S cluster-binding domain-containing protein [Bacteroidota bacterium]
MHDGPGIRSTVFFQGCPLRCWWCHNPECMPIDSEETGATKYSPASLLEEIRKDEIFFSESNGGVTFSGGEPMLQALFLKKHTPAMQIKKDPYRNRYFRPCCQLRYAGGCRMCRSHPF